MGLLSRGLWASVLLNMALFCKADSLIFASFPIPLMVESESEGVFIELAQAVASQLGEPVLIKVFPAKRAIQELVHGQVDVLFPALDVFFDQKAHVSATSELIYIKQDFVFTRKGHEPWSRIEDLIGQKVGLTSGYPYVKALLLDNRIAFDYSLSDEIGVQKLMLGRVDGFVVEEKSGLKAFEKTHTLERMQYQPNQPLSKQNVYFACQGGEAGQALAKRLSKALKALKADGTFARIMSKAQ